MVLTTTCNSSTLLIFLAIASSSGTLSPAFAFQSVFNSFYQLSHISFGEYLTFQNLLGQTRELLPRRFLNPILSPFHILRSHIIKQTFDGSSQNGYLFW